MPKEALQQLLGHGEKGHSDGSELALNELYLDPENIRNLPALYFDGTKFSAQYFEADTKKQVSIIREGLLDEVFESLEALSSEGSKPDISEPGDILWFTSGYLRLFGLRLEDVKQPESPMLPVSDVEAGQAAEFIDDYLQARHYNAAERLRDFAENGDLNDTDKALKLESKVLGTQQSQDFVKRIELGSTPKGANQPTSPTYAQIFNLMKRFKNSEAWSHVDEGNKSGVSPLEDVIVNNPQMEQEVLTLAAEMLQMTHNLTGYDLQKVMLVNLVKTHARQHLRDEDPTAHRVDAVSQVGLDNREKASTYEATSIVELAETEDSMVDIFIHQGREDESRSEYLGAGELHELTRREIGRVSLNAIRT
jgi:hypothetical protein